MLFSCQLPSFLIIIIINTFQICHYQSVVINFIALVTELIKVIATDNNAHMHVPYFVHIQGERLHVIRANKYWPWTYFKTSAMQNLSFKIYATRYPHCSSLSIVIIIVQCVVSIMITREHASIFVCYWISLLCSVKITWMAMLLVDVHQISRVRRS